MKEESIDQAPSTGAEIQQPNEGGVKVPQEYSNTSNETNVKTILKGGLVPDASGTEAKQSEDGLVNPQDSYEVDTSEVAPADDDADLEGEDSPKRKNSLRSNIIYALSRLLVLGYIFGKLSINRSINDRALKAKVKSIKETGLISPCLVVTARQCLNEGLEVCHSDGTKIDDEKEDLDKILIIIDGQHRYEAIRKINSNRKQDEQIECYFYLPLNQDGKTNIISILRESNVATAPWKGGDYLTNILLKAHSDVDLAMPLWVQQRYGDCGDTASWLWATLDPSRVYSKSMIVKASTNQDLLKKLADPTYFDYGKQLYEAALKKFGEKIVKLKVLPLTIISISKKLLAEKSMAEAARILVDFINQIPENSATAIQNFKKDENGTKDVHIERKLNELWETYSNSCGAAKASN